MRFARDDQMSRALALDRSDQPFGKAILPRRGWRCRIVPDAHATKSTCDNGAINLIPIADEVARHFIPGTGNYPVCGISTQKYKCCQQWSATKIRGSPKDFHSISRSISPNLHRRDNVLRKKDTVKETRTFAPVDGHEIFHNGSYARSKIPVL
jgi:hypothetical protein